MMLSVVGPQQGHEMTCFDFENDTFRTIMINKIILVTFTIRVELILHRLMTH
jgi:hypothetical protein